MYLSSTAYLDKFTINTFIRDQAKNNLITGMVLYDGLALALFNG